MVDLFLFVFIMGFLAAGLRKPFLWVLTYIYIDIVTPQKIGWTLVPMLPISLIAFVAAFAGWLLADSKEGSSFSLRQALIAMLLCWCAVTLLWADFPVDARFKWDWVWKALVFAIFMPLTLRTKLRIEAAALVMVLSVGAITIAGGLKTVAGGGGYGQLSSLVNENSGIYEGSTISMVAIAIIPLILWLVRNGTIFPKSPAVMVFAGALIFACLMIPIGTQARTGLICIGVLAVLILRTVKHRFLYMAGGAFLMMAAIPFLPDSYTERMSTIKGHQGDESASTRVAVWMWTLDYVKSRPLGGGFDAYRSNSFTYDTKVAVERGGVTSIETQQVTDNARAYHSSYFEVLGEQGWPGLFLWLSIHALGLWQMERIRRKYRKSEDALEKSWCGLATALQQGQMIYLVGALFIGIAYQPFIFMLIALQIALWTKFKTRETERAAAQAAERRAARRARMAELHGHDVPQEQPT